jgi:hypothetical protein
MPCLSPSLGEPYEELRAFSLGEQGAPSLPRGLGILCQQGLGAWIRVASMLTQVAPTRPPLAVARSPSMPEQEIVHVLAAMALTTARARGPGE